MAVVENREVKKIVRKTARQLIVEADVRELLKRVRGYFIEASKIQDACESGLGFHDEDIDLTSFEVRVICHHLPCPCGRCEYYAIEIFPKERRWVSHHHSKGKLKEGYY
jgi:hypothetical protein